MAVSYLQPAASSPNCPHWSYEDQAAWGSLACNTTATSGIPVINYCSLGQFQSPVNVDPSGETLNLNLPRLTFAGYAANPSMKVTNNGHSIQSTYTTGTYKNDNAGTVWGITQFHFHTHSEETVAGHSDVASMHMVHSQTGLPPYAEALSVLGVLFVIGADNPLLDTLIAALPLINATGLFTNINFTGFQSTFQNMQANNQDDYYNYPGSLTTPPCSELVDWTILATPWTMSQTQLDRLNSVLVSDVDSTITPGRSNYRNIQRTVGANGTRLDYWTPTPGSPPTSTPASPPTSTPTSTPSTVKCGGSSSFKASYFFLLLIVALLFVNFKE